jgi:hypothetical protein
MSLFPPTSLASQPTVAMSTSMERPSQRAMTLCSTSLGSGMLMVVGATSEASFWQPSLSTMANAIRSTGAPSLPHVRKNTLTLPARLEEPTCGVRMISRSQQTLLPASRTLCTGCGTGLLFPRSTLDFPTVKPRSTLPAWTSTSLAPKPPATWRTDKHQHLAVAVASVIRLFQHMLSNSMPLLQPPRPHLHPTSRSPL